MCNNCFFNSMEWNIKFTKLIPICIFFYSIVLFLNALLLTKTFHKSTRRLLPRIIHPTHCRNQVVLSPRPLHTSMKCVQHFSFVCISNGSHNRFLKCFTVFFYILNYYSFHSLFCFCWHLRTTEVQFGCTESQHTLDTSKFKLE